MQKSARLLAFSLLNAVLALGCEDVQGPEAPTTRTSTADDVALIVSDPVADGGTNTSAVMAGPVYAALAPGSVPAGAAVSIVTRSTGARTTAEVVNGGFDPVVVSALAGDTLDVRIEWAAGGGVLRLTTVVPERKPPVLVRTEPPPMKKDVPLNAMLRLVFSEPIDGASLTATSVQLLRGGAPVAGTVGFADEAHLVVVFAPTRPLAFDAEYTLRVTREIRDLAGDSLEADVSVSFVTEEALRGKLVYIRSASVDDDPYFAGVYAMNVDGSDPVLLTDHPMPSYSPAVSPDGAKIAFTALHDGGHDIYVMNADGSNPLNLTNHPASDVGAAWSPDGTRIAFTRRIPDGNGDIYVMNADGTNPENLTSDPAFDDFGAAWSPDGTKIAFSRSGSILVMNADGSAPAVLSNDVEVAYGIAPAWSPDGTKIAFSGFRTAAAGLGDYDVYVMNADGTDPVNLTNHPAYDWFPAWSPDGTKVAFATRRDGLDEIYVMNADGSNPVNLTNDPESADWMPSWSPE